MNGNANVSGNVRPGATAPQPTLLSMLSSAESRLLEMIGRTVTIRETLFGSVPRDATKPTEAQRDCCYDITERLHNLINRLEEELSGIGNHL